MVRKCCVSKCTSSSSMPVHRFPKNKEKAEAWLKAIDWNDLIVTLLSRKLQVTCTLHLSLCLLGYNISYILNIRQ
ncbi:hypothetical protein PUN28_020856 [Cardiocondyla obscurior]|uniref:THAP-type domain-containing protein n=1 Tax=Cardiocondyla obscurior TaxID=286306 RepID=A0AAW2E908_9HYME